MDKRGFNYPEENGFYCANCKFWRANDVEKGQCVRFPPTVINNSYETIFPETASVQWCGEWQIQELTFL